MADWWSSDRRRPLATIISSLSHPLLLVIASMIFLTTRYTDNFEERIRWAALGLALLIVAPAIIYVIISRRSDRRFDIDVSNRADRPVPLMVASLGALVGGYLIGNHLQSGSLLLISNVLVAMLLLLTIVSLVWKISVHTSTLTALVTMLVLFRGDAFVWLYLLTNPVAWARYYLRQHTVAQLAAGSVLGVLVTYLASLAFR